MPNIMFYDVKCPMQNSDIKIYKIEEKLANVMLYDDKWTMQNLNKKLKKNGQRLYVVR